ncbi:hypothetical protein J3459_004034 [Metarhizium acridum]|nr:hypothetical protein J3459_004034 [Metarhizium acridum]
MMPIIVRGKPESGVITNADVIGLWFLRSFNATKKVFFISTICGVARCSCDRLMCAEFIGGQALRSDRGTESM